MKKNFLLLLSLCVAVYTYSQVSFEKKKIVVGYNFDIGIYNTEGYLNDLPNFKFYDKAGSTINSLWGEYGVTNWLGVGLKIAKSKYFTEKDTVTNTQPTISSTDIGLQLSAHVVRLKKFDLPLTLVFGTSAYNDKENDAANTTAKDLGSFYNFSINPRFFFGSKARFGMNIKIGWAGYTYSSIDVKNNTATYNNFYTIKGNGGNFLFGFQYNIK